MLFGHQVLDLVQDGLLFHASSLALLG
jgi:hypothetical protein